MPARRRLGLGLIVFGFVFLILALTILIVWPEVGARVAAIGLPAGVLGLSGVIVLMAEGEYLAEDDPPRPAYRPREETD